MKKLFLLAVIALCGVTAFAQKNASKSSNVYVGGGIGFQSTSYDGNSNTAITFSPEIGYKMSDKWGIGISLNYSENDTEDGKVTTFAINPYVRQNVLSWGQIGLILDYQLLYKSQGPKDGKTNTLQAGIRPGLAMNINSKLSVVTHLGFVGYQSEKPDYDDAKATNIFAVKADTRNIGLSIYYNF
ncbi:MAG: porin family protein [Prevotella sp.]|nr:porin family protein [Prevotella sp.]